MRRLQDSLPPKLLQDLDQISPEINRSQAIALVDQTIQKAAHSPLFHYATISYLSPHQSQDKTLLTFCQHLEKPLKEHLIKRLPKNRLDTFLLRCKILNSQCRYTLLESIFTRCLGLPIAPYQLSSLNLSHQNLRNIPPEIGAFESLVFLNLSHNHLTSLPPSIGRLKQLKHIDISHNRLETFPRTFAHLESLYSVYASHNLLTQVPLSLLQLEPYDLDLSHNHLLSIPEDLKKLTFCHIDLENNRFCDATLLDLYTNPPHISSFLTASRAPSAPHIHPESSPEQIYLFWNQLHPTQSLPPLPHPRFATLLALLLRSQDFIQDGSRHALILRITNLFEALHTHPHFLAIALHTLEFQTLIHEQGQTPTLDNVCGDRVTTCLDTLEIQKILEVDLQQQSFDRKFAFFIGLKQRMFIEEFSEQLASQQQPHDDPIEIHLALLLHLKHIFNLPTQTQHMRHLSWAKLTPEIVTQAQTFVREKSQPIPLTHVLINDMLFQQLIKTHTSEPFVKLQEYFQQQLENLADISEGEYLEKSLALQKTYQRSEQDLLFTITLQQLEHTSSCAPLK